MPILVEWDDADETIIKIEFSGKWTWEEFFEANQQASAMMAEKPYRMDIIANMRPGKMETAGPALYNARQALAKYPENFHLLVVVVNPLIGMLTDIFKHFDSELGASVIGVSTLEQARQHIHKERAESLR